MEMFLFVLFMLVVFGFLFIAMPLALWQEEKEKSDIRKGIKDRYGF